MYPEAYTLSYFFFNRHEKKRGNERLGRKGERCAKGSGEGIYLWIDLR